MSTDPLRDRLQPHLPSEIINIETSSASSGSPCFIVQTTQQKYFVKTNALHPSALDCEETGLNEMRRYFKNTPEVIFADRNLLVIDYIESHAPSTQYWQNLARGLAQMHQQRHSHFGLDQDNWIGASEQKNTLTPAESWGDFFWYNRLQFKLEQLQQKKAYQIGPAQKEKLKKVCLSELNNIATHPSPLHGDLWSGNVLCGPDDSAWLIDPAFYYGDREADIAMTQCFGGFPPVFYETYQQEYPLDSGFEKRRHIYNLYHMLNHFVIFGESYRPSVETIISLVMAD